LKEIISGIQLLYCMHTLYTVTKKRGDNSISAIYCTKPTWTKVLFGLPTV